jgi:hypothetical protein
MFGFPNNFLYIYVCKNNLTNMKKNNNPDDLFVSYTLNKEDLALFFPYLLEGLAGFNIDLTLLEVLKKPKTRRGRKPKPHRSHDNNIFETKSSIN